MCNDQYVTLKDNNIHLILTDEYLHSMTYTTGISEVNDIYNVIFIIVIYIILILMYIFYFLNI